MAYPVVESRTSGTQPLNIVFSIPITIPTGVVAGDLLVAIFASQWTWYSSFMTVSKGWNFITQRYTAFVNGSVWYKIADGDDAGIINTNGSSGCCSHVTLRISGGLLPIVASWPGNGRYDPPNNNRTVSRDILWIAAGCGYNNTAATAAPSGYSNLYTKYLGSTWSGCVSTAEKTSTAASEDPGLFTNPNQAYIAFTIAVLGNIVMKAYDGTTNIQMVTEFPATSKLRVGYNGFPLGITLVPTTDANASKFRFFDGTSIKAVKKA